MKILTWFGGVLAVLCSVSAAPRPWPGVQAELQRFEVHATLPTYETSVAEIEATREQTLQQAEAAVAAIADQPAEAVTFASSFGKLDTLIRSFSDTAQRLALIRSTHPEAAVRDAAAAASVELSNWWVGLDYHPGLYRVLKAFADRHEPLEGEAARFVKEVLRDYRRAGLDLPDAERAEVERMRKELNELSNTFEMNIAAAKHPLLFTAEELAGVPASVLDSPGVRQPDGRYQILPHVTWHALAIFENGQVSATRRAVAIARGQLAREENVPVLQQMVQRRAELAGRLGYRTWADFRTEIQMAGSADAALAFENQLVQGLDAKFQEEKETLRQLKIRETNNPDAQLDPWDYSYYLNQLKSERYSVDTEALRVYFPYGPTLSGMFRIYEQIFDLRFSEVEPPYVWAPGVTLHLVTDRTSGEPIGLFYLDMFPREGKYNHFACFPILTGGPTADGRYSLPLVSLVCNFPPPSAEQPSLLKHDDVVTLFHEFGHVMHALLGRSTFHRFSAFSVPQDFVEAPSQMLENWVWEKAVLDTFAADYRDPAKKVPAETIEALEQARIATAGSFYRRQLSFGLVDLALHTLPPGTEQPDVAQISNEVLARVGYPPAPDTVFAAYFGHLSGYDAAYYGYMWSLAIAADLASAFREAPGGFLDEETGRRLRSEVYAAGATRDVAVSVEQFLGRPRSLDPFLEFVGVKREAAPASSP